MHIGNSLITMYAKCGALARAQQVLEELPARDVVSWNALISGYVQHGQAEKAFICYEKMRIDGLAPDAVTYSCVLKACGITKEIRMGSQIHEEIVYRRLLVHNIILGTALVDMYAKCGVTAKARRVLLEELPARDAISWNALIAGHVNHGEIAEALNCYQHMRRDGLSADEVTYTYVLKACGIIGAVDRGKQIHDEIANQGLLCKSLLLGNALVDMYVKCGMVAKAQETLERLPTRDVISWSALIVGFVQQGQGSEALACFQQMQREGIFPNSITYACIFKACGITKDLEVGKQIQDEVASKELLNKHVELGTALIDMYAKCGILRKAREVLDNLPLRDVVSWSALIVGYAQHGEAEQALDGFQQMCQEGFIPDLVCWNALIVGFSQQGKPVEAMSCFQWMIHEGYSPNPSSFRCVLNACSHSGLLDDGQMYFDDMIKNYAIVPDIEHQTCMIDLFGRAGHIDKAMQIFEKIESYDHHSPVWSSLMNSCRKWGNVKLGRLVFEKAVELDGHDAALYACMAEIYADAGRQEDIKTVESMKFKMLFERNCYRNSG